MRKEVVEQQKKIQIKDMIEGKNKPKSFIVERENAFAPYSNAADVPSR